MKEILIVFVSSFKFAMTFPLAVLEYRMTVFQALIYTNTGGAVGVFGFYYLSDGILSWWRSRILTRRKLSTRKLSKVRPLFTKRNRKIAGIKSKYGLPGIALITPLLLSIPVGAFIAARYFRPSKAKFAWFLGSNFIWSVIYIAFYRLCHDFWFEFLVPLVDSYF